MLKMYVLEEGGGSFSFLPGKRMAPFASDAPDNGSGSRLSVFNATDPTLRKRTVASASKVFSSLMDRTTNFPYVEGYHGWLCRFKYWNTEVSSNCMIQYWNIDMGYDCTIQ